MRIRLLGITVLIGCMSMAQADTVQTIDVGQLAFTPETDGVLSEWQAQKPYNVKITPAIKDDDENETGTLEVEFWIGVSNGIIHVAARWPDDNADTDFRPWEWRGGKYRRSKKRDDMFALRFAKSGEYNRSMIADANYEADVWVWSAGRSNLVGKASDQIHRITLKITENAAEYETESGKTVYIDRNTDAGSVGYDTKKVGKVKTESRLPSIDISGDASGSAADVSARGIWADGFWSLEMQRALDTGHSDDVKLSAAQEILGQIAVFNKNGSQHKSVSELLLFKFAK